MTQRCQRLCSLIVPVLTVVCGVGLIAGILWLPEHSLLPAVLAGLILMALLTCTLAMALRRSARKQQQTEAAVAFERHLLRSLLDNIPDSVYFKDLDSRFLRISRSQAERYGLQNPDEAIGKCDVDFFGEDYARLTRADELYIIRTGNPLIGKEEHSLSPSGEDRWMLSTKLPLKDPTGQIIGTFGISRDITQRKKQEQALRQSEERYRSLVEATAAIVWNTPASGEFEQEQPAWSDFTGQTFEQLRGWGWLDAIHPDDREATAQAWAKAVETRSIYETAHRVRHRDGDYRPMWVRAVPILGHDGQIREWIGLHMEIVGRGPAQPPLSHASRTTFANPEMSQKAEINEQVKTLLENISSGIQELLESNSLPCQNDRLIAIQDFARQALTVLEGEQTSPRPAVATDHPVDQCRCDSEGRTP